MTHETGDVRQVIERMRKLAASRAEDIAVNECPPEAECDDCDTVRALRDGAEALESLITHPAPSGWQQRIAAMDPWADTRWDARICRFCEVERYRLKDGKQRETPHAVDCLWQNAVDAFPPSSAKDGDA